MLLHVLLQVLICCALCSLSNDHAYATDQANNKIIMAKQPPTVLTLKEAVEIAILNKPNLQAYKYAIEAAKARGHQAFSEYLPQISLNTRIGQTIGDQSLQTTLNLHTSQLIYSFAGPIEKYKKAKKQTNIQELSYDDAKSDVKFYVEQAFLECWKLQQHNQDILAFHQSNQSTYETAAHANKLQLTDKSTWLSSSADYAKGLTSIDNYYKDLALAQKQLEFFMGQPIDLNLTTLEAPESTSAQKNGHVLTLALAWKEPVDIKVHPLDTYYKYAMKTRDSLKIADKKIGIARDEMHIQQRSNLPSVRLDASAGYQSVKSTVVGQELLSLGKAAPRNRYNVNAVISWPIFNGLLTEYREKEAHADMVREILMKEQVTQEIKIAIDKAYTSLLEAINNLKAEKAQLIFAKNELTLKQQQFKIGQISQVDLDAAITSWEKAHYAWLDKTIEASKKERALAHECGYPKELFDA